jgi:hypothetical protein
MRKHTDAQLTLLSIGSAISAEDITKDIGKTKQPTKDTAKPTDRKSFSPPKPFSKMTSSEYREYERQVKGSM